MLPKIMPALLMFFAFCFFAGCSSQSNPTTPAESALSGQPLVGVSEKFPDGSPASGIGALGVFNLSVNADEISAELTPIRQNSLTDVLEVVDITNFLRMAPCSDCAKFESISLDSDGNLVVSIGIKHPFLAGDPLKPITGKNRGDLHVFNVEGTIVSNTTGTPFIGLGETTAGFALVNADGYTPYLDTVLDEIYPTDATVHPYILHFDDYTAGNFDASNPMGFESITDPPPSGNLVMAMGCDYNYQDYVLNIDGSFDFIYAVGCTYAVSSASKNARFTPEYRIPLHNKKAASEVSIEIITNDLKGEDTLSTADIEIHVVDVSHGVAVGTNLNEMFADSSVGGITIEIPGVETSTVIVDISSPTGSGHDPSDPLIFPATITNTAGGGEGTYTGLVKVVDSYSSGLNESPLLNGMDGIKRVGPIENPLTGLFIISEFASYQAFSVDIATGNEPPVAILEPDPVVVNIYMPADFDATNSYDTDGSIALYEFDFEWDSDPLNFAADESNTTGLATSSPYGNIGIFTAGLRVTDNLSAVAYDSVEVTANPCNETISVWETGFPEMSYGRTYAGYTVVDNKVWIIGGYFPTQVEVFDVVSETFDTTPHASLPSWRASLAVTHYDGKIYCIGGYNGSRLNTTLVYDIAENTWDTSSVPPFPGTPRNVIRAITYQDEIYAAFGFNPDYGHLQNDLDIYTPATNTWRMGADANVSRAGPFFVLVGDRMYAGVSNGNVSSTLNTIEYYEPATDTWTLLDGVEMFQWRSGPSAVVVGTKIYLAGGHTHSSGAVNYVDAFDTETLDWTDLLDLPEDRGFNASCALYNCQFFLIGGEGDNDVNLTTVIAGQL